MTKNMKYFGVVEGYFAKPYPMWNWDNRNLILETLVEFGNLSTYFYCPKDDPKVTFEWDKAYSSAEISKFKGFVQKCIKNNITFVYGLNPSMKSYKDVENNFKAYVAKIIEKFAQLQQLGVTTFCVLYDDIPLAYTALEGRMLSEALEFARLQCLVVNEVQKKLGSGCNLWFCSSEYFFIKKNPYTRALNKYLNNNIALIWTGNKVFTKKITKNMLVKAKNVVNSRELIWWNNYPVNDPMSEGFLNLGGFNKPGTGVISGVKGILINPMREVSPNIPYLLSFAKYLSDPNKYVRAKIYRRAFCKYYNISSSTIFDTLFKFSNRSGIDNGLKYEYKKLRDINVDAGTDRFLYELKKSYINIKNSRLPKDFKLLISQILAMIEPSQKIFDCFPVPVDATYLNRNLLIVLLRLLLDFKAQKGFEDSYRTIKALVNKVIRNKPMSLVNITNISLELSSVCKLYNKYLNYNKIELTGVERKNVETVLLKLIVWENGFYARIISKLDKIDKLRAFSLRLNINQYRIESLLVEIERFNGDF